MKYVIWSNQHGQWWRAKSLGYCQNIADAGQYTREEAMRIVGGATLMDWPNKPPSELPIRIADLPREARKHLKQGCKDDQ